MSDHEQIIEHVVLFKVKQEADPTQLAAIVNGLNSLTLLNLTVHLSAGKLLRSHSPSLTFTHILHARYKSKTDLHNYTVHPEHIRVVQQNNPIVDDVMAVDWISNGVTGPSKPGSKIRFSLFKLYDNLDRNEKNRVLEVIAGFKNQLQTVEEFSFGENFSYDRAKGYTIGLIVVVPGTTDLKSLDLNMEKVKDSVEDVVVVDYVIPSTN